MAFGKTPSWCATWWGIMARPSRLAAAAPRVACCPPSCSNSWLMLLCASGYGSFKRTGIKRRAAITIFYINDTYLASQDAGFLQHALTLLVDLFQQVGLQTNTSKTQTMICTLGRIQTQLPTKSYCRMQRSMVTAAKWNSQDVKCYQ